MTSQIDDLLRTTAAEIQQRALMSYPDPLKPSETDLVVMGLLLRQSVTPIVITHPTIDIRLELNVLLGSRICYLIASGDYEQHDLEIIQEYVRDGDVVLECGGGAGVTTALLGKITGRTVNVVEPDPQLAALIKRNVELNDATVSITQACVTTVSDETVKFHIAKEIWFSSLQLEAHETTATLSVPTRQLEDLVEEHRPSVLIMDIEGIERELFRASLDPAPRLIIIEIHFPILGSRASSETVQRIIRLGYNLIDIRGWTFVFSRCE